MRSDQLERLIALEETIVDALIVEIDPENWSGAGKKPSEMTRDERGDRDWDKKGGARTLSIALRLRDLLDPTKNTPHDHGGNPLPADGDPAEDEARAVESEIGKYTRMAADILDKVQARTRKNAK